MLTLPPADFVAMESFEKDRPVRVYLAYAHDRPPNIFGKIYRDGAKLWLYKPLAEAVLAAADHLHDRHSLYLKLYDGLRTTDAQRAMQETEIALANPHWFEEPRVLSPPGQGAHPRGMAIDCEPVDESGRRLDMGTVFDHLAEITDEKHNPAHRFYTRLTEDVRANRKILDEAMRLGAEKAGIELHLLDTEWWDFRLPRGYYERFAPLADADLPPEMRMVSAGGRVCENTPSII